jgi:PAS domain S-box-containing protein
VKPISKDMFGADLGRLSKDRRRLSLLLVIMTTVVFGVGAILLLSLYKASFEQQRARLVEIARSQARLMEAVAAFDVEYSANDVEGGAFGATLSQIRKAHARFGGSGETGELDLARREGDRIVYLLPHRHGAAPAENSFPFFSKRVEAMRRALSGESGSLVARDHHGERVLAAYEPVAVLGIGIVAKIDLAEIQAPFVRIAWLGGGGALLLVFVGTALFMRCANPLIRRLEESESKYRALFDSATDGVYVLGDVFEDCNEQACRHWGCEREDIIGHTPVDFSPPRQPDGRASEEAAKERIKAALSGKPQFFYWKHRRKDGVTIDEDISLHAVKIGDRKVLVCTGRDISDHKRAEQRLHLQGAALESTASGIAVTDREGTILWINPAFTRMTGYRAEEVIGRNPRLLKSGKQDRRFYKDLWDTILAGKTWEGELHNRRKDGSLYIEEQIITPVLDARGEISHFVSVTHDITERKKAEIALQQKSEDLERSNRDLEQFAYAASHDLQEPLRTVASYAQLLSRRYSGKLGDDAEEFIRYTVDGAERMKRMITDLLDYSRVGIAGKPVDEVPAQEILEEALENLAAAIRESGARVSADPLPALWVDRAQFVRLFQNLIGDAIKFRGEATPRIHVGVLPQGGAWQFSFSDNGIGIEPQYLERIFGLFQRLHERSAFPGTGMGLALCRKIVEQHGGRMWAESTPGEGTTFHFTVPIASGA